MFKTLSFNISINAQYVYYCNCPGLVFRFRVVSMPSTFITTPQLPFVMASSVFWE